MILINSEIKIVVAMTKFSLYILLLFVIISCDSSYCKKDNLHYGKYQSNVVKDDFIILNKDGTYRHIVKSMKYNKKGTWDTNGCNIYFKEFNEVIDKFNEKPIADTSKTGSYQLLIGKRELENPEESYGYKYFESE